MKKKLLFMLINMNIGGTERSFLNLLYTLNPDEFDVTLLLLEEKGGYLEDVPSWVNVRILEGYQALKPEIMEPPLAVAGRYFQNGKPGRAAGIASRHLVYKLTGNRAAYYRYVLSNVQDILEEYDTAVAYAGPMDFISLYILEHVKAREKIQWVHFDISRIGFDAEFARRHFKRFDHVFVVSNAAKEQLLRYLPDIADITEIKPNIISKEQCLKEAEKGKGFTDDYNGFRILTVGRLSEEKGQEIIPDVAKKLKDSGYRFRWYLIGSGKTEENIRRKLKEYRLENTVVLLGTIKNPFPYYSQCNLYVQTSMHEGYCISLAEAQAFDKPIVSTDVAGAKDFLSDGNKARVVNFNSEEIYNMIVNCIEEVL